MRLVKNKAGQTIIRTDDLVEATSLGVSIIHSAGIKTKKDLRKVFDVGKKIWEVRAKHRGEFSDPPPERLDRLPGLLCKNCESFIYSSHRHDFKVCGCFDITGGTQFIAIDGGFDYVKITGDMNRMVHAELDVSTWKVYAEPYIRGKVETTERFKTLHPEV